MQIYDRYTDTEFWENWLEILYQHEWTDYDDWVEKYGVEKNTEATSKRASIGSYFEGLGLLVNRKLIDIDIVDELMRSPILWFWEKYEPMFKERRKRINNPRVWEWVEYLNDEIKKYEEQQASTSR